MGCPDTFEKDRESSDNLSNCVDENRTGDPPIEEGHEQAANKDPVQKGKKRFVLDMGEDSRLELRADS